MGTSRTYKFAPKEGMRWGSDEGRNSFGLISDWEGFTSPRGGRQDYDENPPFFIFKLAVVIFINSVFAIFAECLV